MKNPWSDRFEFVKNYISNGLAIIDFGCGNREILDFVQPSEYFGIDLVETADLIANLNCQIEISKHYDLGLLLGVLEYLDDPEFTLKNIYQSADKFIILTLPVKKKSNWQRTYANESIDSLLGKFFKNVVTVRHGRYLISVCTNNKEVAE